jgi:hypothetical protein
MEIVLKYFGVLIPISLNLLIHSISFFNVRNEDQKIIHRWNYELEKSTWTTQSSKNIGKVLEHLKLGLDDESHFFFNCGINKKDIRATFLKKKLTIILIIGKRHK